LSLAPKNLYWPISHFRGTTASRKMSRPASNRGRKRGWFVMGVHVCLDAKILRGSFYYLSKHPWSLRSYTQNLLNICFKNLTPPPFSSSWPILFQLFTQLHRQRPLKIFITHFFLISYACRQLDPFPYRTPISHKIYAYFMFLL
jgi:hypothetical protein